VNPSIDPAGSPAPGRVTHELRSRVLTVLRVVDLGPRMRRVVLGGPDLDGFVAVGPTDHVKVFFPAAPGAALAVPTVQDGAWVDRGHPSLTYREYTVRTFDPAARELALDMTVHTDGPAGRWAALATPGERLAVLGPKTSKVPALDAAWYLLAADEAGLPALLNWLGRIPADARVLAVVEVDGAADEVPVPRRAGLTHVWVHRGGAAPGGTLLRDAVAASGFGLGDGGGRVWAGAEAASARALRRHLLEERGVPRGALDVTGYWRAGVAHFDHKSPEATS
jgi:NADPH-dependent ferric siderophore reductase